VDRLHDWLVSLPRLWPENHLLQATALIVSSIVLAKLSEWVLVRVVGGWAKRTTVTFDDELLQRLHRPIFLSVLVAGLWLTAEVLELPASIQRITLGTLATILVVVWLAAALRILSLIVEALSRSGRSRLVEPQTAPLFDNLGKIILAGVAVYFLFKAWNFDPAPWLASAGIVGIAVGFAAKDTLANLFSGVFIFADAPYRVGDFINLDTGERGQVTNIGLRSTRILTRDEVEITIPNAVIAAAKIVNESGGPSPHYRLRVPVGVSYDSDLDKVYDVLIAVATGHEKVEREPEPRVRFRRFGDSALELELLVWVDEPVLRGLVLHELNTEIFRRFRAEGIEIPYSKHDVYIKSMPQGERSAEP